MQIYNFNESLIAMLLMLVFAFGVAIALDDDPPIQDAVIEPVSVLPLVDPYIAQLDTLLALSLNEAQETVSEDVPPILEMTTLAVIEDDGLIDEFEFYEIIANTPWPVSRWGQVWEISSCESSNSGHGDVNPEAIGDLSLVPRTGPSLGAMQINIRAHPELHRTFDLLDITDNLIAGYVVWLKAGGSFTPWSCFGR